jgi:signal transduction histidine kinase
MLVRLDGALRAAGCRRCHLSSCLAGQSSQPSEPDGTTQMPTSSNGGRGAVRNVTDGRRTAGGIRAAHWTRGDWIIGEEAALRRVATLVARGAQPDEVFAAVTMEAGQLLGAHHARMSRYDPDGSAQVVATWSSNGAAHPAGARTPLGGRNLYTQVFRTGRAARIDDYASASGPATALVRELGVRASVAAPVIVEGRLWGAIFVGSTQEPLPAGTEARLAGFTDLAATAIANAQARVELREFAEEQAALRRVATLVAQCAPAEEVFDAIAREAGRLLRVDYAVLARYDPDGQAAIVSDWARTNPGRQPATGLRLKQGGQNVNTIVFETAQSARIDDYDQASGASAEFARDWGYRSAVGVPISVESRLWGVMTVASAHGPLPVDAEARLAGFTELAATAIANAEAQAARTAARARVVAAADAARRRIERDLHDGAQQRLVSLGLQLRMAQAAPPGPGEQRQWLAGVGAELAEVLEELREIARGLHPAILTQGGLRPALKALARRSAVPVELDVKVAGRLPEPVELAAYYVVAEALTNTAKHAHASVAEVQVATVGGALQVRVRDDGRGGAEFGPGSGLVGIKDRAEALGGRISLHSPPGAGTVVDIALPLGDTLPVRSANPEPSSSML